MSNVKTAVAGIGQTAFGKGLADTELSLACQAVSSALDDAGIARDKPTITYCQGGIRAAHAAFVLDLLGYDAVRVYDGSMREWANREDTPLMK